MVLERIRDICNEVGDSSLRIVDAIAYPDAITGSHLSKTDGQLYYNMITTIEKYEG